MSIPKLCRLTISRENFLLFNAFPITEYPHYTRPKTWEDIHGNKHEVPDVLTSGHHEKIDKWRKEKSVEKTKESRPDIFKKEI